MSFNEYAATGFMILPWWTWPCIAVTVVCSILAVMKYDAWKDERAHAKTGPYPCLAHLGTDPSGMDLWCWLREGHTQPHGYPEMFGDDDDEPRLLSCGLCYEENGEEVHPHPECREGLCDYTWVHRHDGRVVCNLPYGHDAVVGSLHDHEPWVNQKQADGPEPVAGSLCDWGEDGTDNEHACRKPAGHLGAHMVQDLSDPSQH